MKCALASYGSRGDIEPCAAVGRELLRRGHDVCMAVPPELVGFVESIGLEAVAYGPDRQVWQDAYTGFWTSLSRNFWRVRDPITSWRELGEVSTQYWGQLNTTLMALADGSDLVLTAQSFEEAAVNVAERHDIPLATLHHNPIRANGQFVSFLPAPLGRRAMAMGEWLTWRLFKKFEDAQRRELGLSKTPGPASRRMTEHGSLEIQAYDEVCFPGLAAEWASSDGSATRPFNRPFVGALALERPTAADDDVASWIAAGTPPIFFGFGSSEVASPADTLAMISAACAQLGERALVCAGATDFSGVAHSDHVKVVRELNYAAIFPACRAVVHHGGAGTTAASLRAGVPTLVLWWTPEQAIWGAQLKRLEVGSGQRFSTTTQKSLVADLRLILAPRYVARARELPSRMTKPAESVTAAADLLEKHACLRRVG